MHEYRWQTINKNSSDTLHSQLTELANTFSCHLTKHKEATVHGLAIICTLQASSSC